MGIMPFLTSGPMFMHYNTNNLQKELQRNWWAYLLFINNLYPLQEEQGLYWLYFIANELQFYIIVLIPSVYMYQKRYWRKLVISYLCILILSSMLYLFFMTFSNGFSPMLTVDAENMFDELFRYPAGPVGYYAIGILFSIFYFEYEQSVSNRDLKNRRAYRIIKYIGRSRRRYRRY